MRIGFVALLAAVATTLAPLLVLGASDAPPDVPVWAYGTDPKAIAPEPKAKPDQNIRHLPGSTLGFTDAQIQDHFGPADWYPADHPAMPQIVAHGRSTAVWACALCHYPNGKGKPENAGIAGFPVSYFVEQMHEFRDGQRQSADRRKKNTALMSAFAKAMTEQEIQQAAEYFGGMKWTPWIKVVETKRVPRTHTTVGMYMPIQGGGTEQLGQRIIEVPIDPDGTEALRNPRSGFTAYVPIGSLEKGRQLASGGGGRTSACGLCHGVDLKGLGPVPGIAGRSPSYLVRQLCDMKQSSRSGAWTELMKPVVKDLSQDDMLNLAAYISSLQP